MEQRKQLSNIEPIDRENAHNLFALYSLCTDEEIASIEHLLHVSRAFTAHRLKIQGDSADQNHINESQDL